MVRTSTRTPEEVDGDKAPTVVATAIAVTITETRQLQNMHLKETTKDGPTSKFIITETGHKPTQYKKITKHSPRIIRK